MSEHLIFLIDQDGPLADFDAKFNKTCRDAGFTFECEYEDRTARFMDDHIIDEVERAEARALVDSPDWFLNLPVVEGAIDGMHKLAEVPNSEVWICTKPLESNKTCRDEKAAWVEKHLGDDWVHRLILAPDKSLVQGHVLLDDAPRLEWTERATWVPVVFPMVWNQDGSEWDGMLTWTWSDDLDILVEIAKSNAYYSQHRSWGYL